MPGLPDVWSMSLAMFAPTAIFAAFLMWGIRSVLKALREISTHILAWHGSAEGIAAHDEMIRKYTESEAFRARVDALSGHKINNAIQPLTARMDLLESNMRTLYLEMAKEMREEMREFKSEVLKAIAKRGDSDRR